jgi:hypothetical protein
MFVRLKKSAGTVNPVVQRVESAREGGKVKQRVLASLGSVQSDQDLERLRALAQNMLEKLQQERVRQSLLFGKSATGRYRIRCLALRTWNIGEPFTTALSRLSRNSLWTRDLIRLR